MGGGGRLKRKQVNTEDELRYSDVRAVGVPEDDGDIKAECRNRTLKENVAARATEMAQNTCH